MDGGTAIQPAPAVAGCWRASLVTRTGMHEGLGDGSWEYRWESQRPDRSLRHPLGGLAAIRPRRSQWAARSVWDVAHARAVGTSRSGRASALASTRAHDVSLPFPVAASTLATAGWQLGPRCGRGARLPSSRRDPRATRSVRPISRVRPARGLVSVNCVLAVPRRPPPSSVKRREVHPLCGRPPWPGGKRASAF